MPELHEIERRILLALATDGGLTSYDVATLAEIKVGCSPRVRSGAALSWLKRMETKGLVRRMDDEKPIAWIKTK